MHKALAFVAMFVALMSAAPAFAAPPPGLDLAAWVRGNTDLAVSQVAITGAENVYSLEPLGPPVSTGEVLALVRTEAVSPQWREGHGFLSWDAHMLFDCAGGRVRVLRSASYAERDRRGAARADDVGGAWFSAEADTPAATLLAAACDPAFRWPLRGASEVSPSPKLEGAMLRTSATGSVAPIERAVNLVQVPPPADAPSPIDVQPLAVSAAPEPIEKVSPPAFAGVERKAADTMAWPTVRRTAIAQAPAGAGFLQKARYVPDSPETLASSSAHTATVAPRAGGFITTTGSAMRAGLRWAVAGPGWLARRMERVFHNGPILPHGQLGPIRQAQLY